MEADGHKGHHVQVIHQSLKSEKTNFEKLFQQGVVFAQFLHGSKR